MPEGNNLTRIWAMTDGIRVEANAQETFVFLRVKDRVMPASYLTPDTWFLMCQRLKPGVWEVGIRTAFLKTVSNDHKKAALDVIKNMNSMKASPSPETEKWYAPNIDRASLGAFALPEGKASQSQETAHLVVPKFNLPR